MLLAEPGVDAIHVLIVDAAVIIMGVVFATAIMFSHRFHQAGVVQSLALAAASLLLAFYVSEPDSYFPDGRSHWAAHDAKAFTVVAIGLGVVVAALLVTAARARRLQSTTLFASATVAAMQLLAVVAMTAN